MKLKWWLRRSREAEMGVEKGQRDGNGGCEVAEWRKWGLRRGREAERRTEKEQGPAGVAAKAADKGAALPELRRSL
jgi:hypothetical protein